MTDLNREFLVKKFGSEDRLKELTQIEVNYNNKIKRINSNAFKGLVNLETISLHQNGIEQLEGGLFEGLLNLKQLYLSKNKLKKIDRNAFEGLDKLERLQLNSNQLTVINVKLFESLSNLKILFLDKNKLKTIEPNTFDGLHKLERLTLDNTEIEEIDVRLFKSLSNLKELWLYNNKLKRIDSNPFENLTKLEILLLHNNSIEEIDEKAFENLINLKEIELNNNKLRRIHSNTFKNLIKLESLMLDENEIEELDQQIFDGLSNLKVLLLNKNKLKWMDKKCFKSFKSMEILQLYENDFKAVSFFIPTNKFSTRYNNKAKLDENRYISNWNKFLEQFDESSEFYNPKLLIVDYYDSIISQIDIYTEELLEKYNENDLLPKISKVKNSFEIESKNESKINVTPESTKIIDYLNLVRSKSIEEINKAKDENLERYESNKDKYKYDRNNLTIEKVQEIKRELFKEKFCFLLKVDKNSKKKHLLHTIVTDFYLDNYNRFLLLNSDISFNMDDFFVLLLTSLISELTKSHENAVISITKASLQTIKHINVISSKVSGKINCKFHSHDLLNLSHIKSIDIRYQKLDDINIVINLKALTNLEYISISGCSISKEMFIGLDKLIGLRLYNCSVFNSPLKRDLFCYIDKLQSLELIHFLRYIYNPEFNLDCLNSFKNLKKLRICIRHDYLENLDFLKYESLCKLEYLNLNWCKIEKIKENDFSKLKNLRYLDISRNRFYFEPNVFLGLDSLETLVIKRSLLNHKKVALKKGVFNGLSSLKTLDLTSNNIEFIEPEVFIHTSKLTHLKISGINCKLNENTFSHLKNLKTIEMAKSDLNYIDSNVLETLKRSNIKLMIY